MKKNKIFILVSLMVFSILSCNDSYLEKFPLDELTNETFWQSENDLKAYVAGLYTSFDAETVWDDDNSDNQATKAYNAVATSKHEENKGTWSWSYLRKCNYFLENYNKSNSLSDDVKNKYKGQVLFFRAMHVYSRIKTYGDIPFTTKALNVNDKDVLYAKRTPRAEVMKQVLADLNEAIKLIPLSASIEGELTRWAALALKARICLHEGTFRKYHKIAGHEKFLNEAATASFEIIDKGGFEIYKTGRPNEDYRNLFRQLSLKSNKEAILYKKYLKNYLGHNFVRYMFASHKDGLTKDMVNDYLCTDGKPIGLSSLFKGDNTLKDEFTDRDPRLLQTIIDIDTGYFDQGGSDEIVPRLFLAKGSGSESTTGYHIIKMYDNDEVAKYADGETDLFLFRYAETLLIYAEAKAELGQADQAVIDASINKLRERVGMPNMVIANLQRDPQSDMTSAAGYLDEEVSVLIEEIRRERRIELACEGFRYDDLMRWRAGKFLEKKALGAKWDAFKDRKDVKGELIYSHVVVGTNIHLDQNGYIDLYHNQLTDRSFNPDKHYYFAIPLQELVLNPNLDQNPGWEKAIK
jgi:hypothetical protein